MYKYKITYTNRQGREVVTSRKADRAAEAVKKLAAQYGYWAKIKLVDADTRGVDCAEVGVYEDSGFSNHVFTAIAKLV